MRYVIDQNMMRHPDLINLVHAEGSDFILPDTAFVEMCKSERWEETMRGSLALLSSIPDRVHGAIAYDYAIKSELETHRPVEIVDLLQRDHTDLIRRIMGALTSEGDALEKLRIDIGEIRRELLDEQVDAKAEKEFVKRLIDAFVNDAGVILVAAVRKLKCSDVVLALVQHVAEMTLCQMLVKEQHMSIETAAEFVSSKPFLLRHYLLRVRQVARWIIEHGFDNVDQDRILNDRFDQEYVVIGSYFDGVLTRDKRAKEAAQDLRAFLDDMKSAALRRIYRDLFGDAEPASSH